MAEPEPRYVLTFRTRTPEMLIVAVLVVLGAAAAVVASWGARAIGCGLSHEDCTRTEGLAPFLFALAGVVPAPGMLVASARSGGHPWRWFFATAAMYAWWALVFSAEFG